MNFKDERFYFGDHEILLKNALFLVVVVVVLGDEVMVKKNT